MAEVPSLNYLARKFAKHPFTLIAVHAPSRAKPRVEDAIQRNHIAFAVALDRELEKYAGETQSLYGIRTIPTKVVIDRKGCVRCITPNLTEAMEKIEEALREGK